MSGWKKVKNLFWEGSQSPSELAPSSAGDTANEEVEELEDDEFAALLSGSEFAVPPGVADSVSVENLELATSEAGEVVVDFQEQYDLAGIPNTDEVEQLESFLSRLDASLPQVSKIAAAEAFLGAIGKERKAVLDDAERKIKRVRGLMQAKEEETARALEQEQAEVNVLTQRIEEHRKKMENINRSLEGLRKACLEEESRLQAARVFFGNVVPSST